MSTQRRNLVTFRPSATEARLEDRLALSGGGSGVVTHVLGTHNFTLTSPPIEISNQLSKLIGAGFFNYRNAVATPNHPNPFGRIIHDFHGMTMKY